MTDLISLHSRVATQFRAADGYGRLICWGLMTPRECLAGLLKAAAKAAPDANPTARRMAITDALREAIAYWDLARHLVRADIVRDLGPLVEARRSSAELMDWAQAANEDAGEPLTSAEVRAAVTQVVEWHLRRSQRAKARAA